MSDINDPEMGDEEDLEDALAWLEQLAAGQGASLDELPSVSNASDVASTPDWLQNQPSSNVVAESADQVDLDWLDDVASGNTPIRRIEEPPTMSWDNSEEDGEMDDLPEDPEEAMAWLEQLSANQGASLDDLSSVPLAAQSGWDLDSGGINAEDLDDDENALDWLEQLAADKGLSLDDLPGMNDNSAVSLPTLGGKHISDVSGATVDIADVLAARSAEMPEDPDEAMIWLENLASEYGLSLNDLAEMLGDEPESDDEQFFDDEMVEPIVSLEPAISEVDFGSELGLEDDEEAAMAWLEKLAAGQGASLDELPSMGNDLFDNLSESSELLDIQATQELEIESAATYDSEGEEVDLDDDDAAMAWLEQLAAGQGASLDELPSVDNETFIRRQSEPVIDLAPIMDVTSEPMIDLAEDDFAMGGEVDLDDDDAAMAWLEQLAAGQGASLDELPSVDTVSEASSMPSDPAAAMSWLEKLAKQSTFVADLPSMAGIKGDEAIDFDLQNIPSDPKSAMAWLEGLASGVPLATNDASANDQATAEAIDPLEAIGLVDMMADDDDDMDDAMAWLEQLAAKQGASMDELPSVDMMRDDLVLPDSLAKQAEKDQEEEDLQTQLDQSTEFSDFGEQAGLEKVGMPDWFSAEIDDDLGLDDDLFSSLGIEDVSLEPESDSFFDLGGDDFSEPLSGSDLTDSLLADDLPELSLEMGDESISDAMPAWFSMDSGSAGDMSSGELGWLDTVVDSDFTNWIAAEAEASKTDLKAVSMEPVRRNSGRGSSRYQSAQQPIKSMGEDPLDLDLSSIGERSPISDQMQLDTNQLQQARKALDSGNYEGAVAGYQTLVQAGADLDTLIVDLKLGIAKNRNQPAIRYLLGDAYRKDNNLDEALKCYRSALIKIS